jgi:DNA-binding transcriptional MerR regulator
LAKLCWSKHSVQIGTIGKIKQNRETNASAVKEQKILVENEIRELRRKIDKRLDQLQENLMKELTEKENGITSLQAL